MTTHREARALEAADKAAEFSWQAWNAQFDADMTSLKEALATWNQVEQELSELHINFARDLREMLP